MSRLPEKPIIYIITPGDALRATLKEKTDKIIAAVGIAADAGGLMIQIREKNLTARDMFDLTAAAVAAAHGKTVKILVNGRADIALASGADGVHLPADGLPASAVRQKFPETFLIGVSTHTAGEAKAANDAGADFVTFGPVFESPGKGLPKGLPELASVCRDLDPFPVIALGGINAANYNDVINAGAAGFAAIRFLNDEAGFRQLRQTRV